MCSAALNKPCKRLTINQLHLLTSCNPIGTCPISETALYLRFSPHPPQISLGQERGVSRGRFHVQRAVREKTSRCPLTSAAMTDDCGFFFLVFAKNVENLSDRGKRLLQTSAQLSLTHGETQADGHTDTVARSLQRGPCQ